MSHLLEAVGPIRTAEFRTGKFKIYIEHACSPATILAHATFARLASNFNPEGMTSRRAVNARNKVVINPRRGSLGLSQT